MGLVWGFGFGVCRREAGGRLWAKAFASQVPTYQWPRLIFVFLQWRFGLVFESGRGLAF